MERNELTIVDATHISKRSLEAYLQYASKEEIVVVDFLQEVDCDEAIRRNQQRKGTCHYVPEAVIRRMAHSVEPIPDGFTIISPSDPIDFGV